MTSANLLDAVRQFGTPLYVYDLDLVRERIDFLKDLFGQRFGISFAVKANPNIALLSAIRDDVATLDASSFAEVERSLAAGVEAARITFSGPAKRQDEIRRAVTLGIGELVVESLSEAKEAANVAVGLGVEQQVLLRVNPMNVPRHFGASMAGRPSQFGIDEEDLSSAINTIMDLDGLNLIGFHIYSGTNSLNAEAIADNFEIFIGVFRDAVAVSGQAPKKLIFGSGFGVPYHHNEKPLDTDDLAKRINPIIDEFLADEIFSKSELVLEMGRWIIGPAGWLLTSVVNEKDSRGVQFRMCDAGFNNHLAACGMMGSVIRRNWGFENISDPDGPLREYTLTGPLCTTIDTLATKIELPELAIGDVLSIENSGAYGLTASPTRFISHPEPREAVLLDGKLVDATESLLNHWGRNDFTVTDSQRTG